MSRERKPWSREQWTEAGRRLKAIERDLSQFAIDLQETATQPYVNRFLRVAGRLDEAKSKLDGLVHQQHPDWPDAKRVFYGESEPNPEA